MKQHFIKLYQYDNWANNLVVDAIVQHDVIDDRILTLISHIIWAKTTWMLRFKKEEITNREAFGIMNMDDLKHAATLANSNYAAFIEDMADFDATLNYVDMRGNAHVGTYEDMLTHVINHGTHHRAQIASRLKEIGLTPPVMDYIVFTRGK